MAKRDNENTDLTENPKPKKDSSTDCGKALTDDNSFEIVTINSRSEPVVFKPELSWPCLTLEILDETCSSQNGSSTNAMSSQSDQQKAFRRFRGVRKRLNRVANIWHSVRKNRYDPEVEGNEYVSEHGEQKETTVKPLKSRIATAVSKFKNKHFTKDAVIKTVACAYGIESDSDNECYSPGSELTGFSNPNYQQDHQCLNLEGAETAE